MREAVTFLTDFADQAVLLPLAVVVALCLGISGWWRGAAAWLLGVGVTLTLMLLFKIAFIACGPADDVLRSPSGHTAAAAVVCGGLATILGVSRRLTVPIAFLAAVVIGGSRMALGAHTPLETLMGGATGIGGAWLIARSAGPVPAFRRGRVAIAAILVVVVLHGARMPAEAHIRGLAWRVGLLLPVCRAT